jgi:hypothetical protein
MSDVYTSVSSRSLGGNLVESIKSFLVGVVMFLASFPLLWINEGCTDLSEVAKTAVVVKADAPAGVGEGKLVSVTSKLDADEPVGDPDMLAPGAYVRLHRKVEMFAWTEKKDSRTEKKVGGGSTTVTTYTYDTAWTDHPPSSDAFQHREGHENPRPGLESADFYPSHARVGSFSFAPKECELPTPTTLALTAAMTRLPADPGAPGPAAPAPTATAPAGKPGKGPKGKPAAPPPVAPTPPPASRAPTGFHLTGGYLFRGIGSPEAGKLGDLRVSYLAVTPAAQVTLYGKREGASVTAFRTEKDDRLFRVVPGTHEQAIAALHGEHVMMTWILRIGGFFAMWMGLAMVVAPINAVLDVVPFVGSAGRFVTSLVMLPIALVLSVVTIVVSIVAHNPILLVVTIVVVVGALVAIVMAKKNRADAAPPRGGPPTGGPPMGGYPMGGPPMGGYPMGGPPLGGYGPPGGR